MSWLFSQALVEEYLVATSSAGAPSALSSVNPTPQLYYWPDKTTAISRLSRSGMTSQPLTENLGAAVLTWCQEVSLAKTSVPQGKAQDSMVTSQDSGQRWLGWLAKYDHDSCSWKTAQCSLLGEEPESLEILPRWGMTVDGLLWEQPTLEPITREIESGLWPSLNARDWKDSGATQGNRKSPNLGTRVHWPTPRTAGMCGGSGSWELLNKNTTPEEARQMGAGNGGKLNPTWVEWLMGWPLGWTDLKPLETGRFQQWQQQHGACLGERHDS